MHQSLRRGELFLMYVYVIYFYFYDLLSDLETQKSNELQLLLLNITLV